MAAEHPSKLKPNSVKFKPPNIEVPADNGNMGNLDDSNSKSPSTPAPPGSAREESEKSYREKKMGHRRVDRETGQVTYKRVPTTQLMGSIQLGIGNAIGSLAGTPNRDLLVQDFDVVDSLAFPSEGTSTTPSHSYGDFRFKSYAPIAFRYFRKLFNIKPEDFLSSVCTDPLRELSNPGASGSVFYVSQDDQFIVKTVQHKEAEFLQKLLPGYYMNLQQNPRTLLPKFFGLFCYQSLGKNVRLLVMNNLLPFSLKMHQKYDLKGSTYKRRASKHERLKPNPTLKDLDFLEDHPEGIYLESETYDALFKTISRDCLVLEAFKIMDFSLLLGIHNIDQAQREKVGELVESECPDSAGSSKETQTQHSPGTKLDPGERKVKRQKSLFSALESIQVDSLPVDLGEEYPVGGLPARNSRGERLFLFVGVIDILQNYRLFKKLEHTWKSVLHDGDTISVHRPGFYADRFQTFMKEKVFKKIPSLDLPEVKGPHRKFRSLVASYMALKQSPSKKRSRDRRGTTASADERHHRSGSHGDAAGSSTARADLISSEVTSEQEKQSGGAVQNGRLFNRRSQLESGRGLLQRQEAAPLDVSSDLLTQQREKKMERLFAATPDPAHSHILPESEGDVSSSITVSRHLIKIGRSMSGDGEPNSEMTKL